MNLFISNLNPSVIAFISALLGAYLNSIFEWIGYRKQKIAEIIIAETKDIHSSNNNTSSQIIDLFAYFREYLRLIDIDEKEATIGKNTYIIPKAYAISTNLGNVGTSFHYMNYFHKFNTDKIVRLNNTWAGYLDFLQLNPIIDKTKINEITDYMSKMIEELNALNEEVLRNTLKVL